MRKAALAVTLAVLVGTVVVAAAVANSSGSAAASQLAKCTNVSLGVNAPLTGPAGFLGQEQLSWAQFAVSQYNKANATRFKIVQGDSQLDAAKARTATQRFISNPNVMDEPSMGLAPILVERSFEIIEQVHDSGVALLVVEQNANVSLSIADRGYVLSTGRVVLEGKAKDLLEHEELRKAYLGR